MLCTRHPAGQTTMGRSTRLPPSPLQVFQYIFRTFLGLRFSDEAFEKEDLDAPHKLCVHHLDISRIFLDGWPDEVPTLFDNTSDGEREIRSILCPRHAWAVLILR